MQIQFSIWWSIYINGANRQRVLEKHIPALNEIIGPGEKDWFIEVEDENPHQTRIERYDSFETESNTDVFLSVMRKAEKICMSDWKIISLRGLDEEKPFYLMLSFVPAKPLAEAPAIKDLLIEVENKPHAVWMIVCRKFDGRQFKRIRFPQIPFAP